MENFYEKIKNLHEEQPKKFLTILWIVGIISGLICWIALRFCGQNSGSFVSWLWIIFFAVIMLGSNKIAKETGINLHKFKIAFAVGLGISLAIFAILNFLVGIEGGLLGYVFPNTFNSF